jgi:hypothetical protein
MLKYLKLQNVGPAAEMELELGSRLNILTGDNGLGKSFLLDVAWYAAGNGSWPEEINSNLRVGRMAIPQGNGKGRITYRTAYEGKLTEYHSAFEHESLSWDRHVKKGDENIDDHKLMLYWMADGSCAVFDLLRLDPNNWEKRFRNKTPWMFPFVFDPIQVWDGLDSENGKVICKGLIEDLASWQKENGFEFQLIKETLSHLSSDPSEPFELGELTRISIDDVRDMPTLENGFSDPTPIVLASSGVKRILAMAYMLVWAWQEHKRAAKLRRTEPFKQMMLLIDEVESHLHPSWQRRILPSLLTVVNCLSPELKVQLIATTHSPLIMASLEPIFDAETDAWFDLDLVGENGHREVKLEKREFEILGNADDWLTSEAFDLESTGSLAAEALLKEVEEAMDSKSFDYPQAKILHEKLVRVLPADDTFFIRWRMIGKKKGWWK